LAEFGIPNKRGEHMANPSLEHWIAVKRIFNTCKAHYNSNYALEDYHPKISSDIVMQIGPMTLRIGNPPQGLYS
jgi:hypothetical protein